VPLLGEKRLIVLLVGEAPPPGRIRAAGRYHRRLAMRLACRCIDSYPLPGAAIVLAQSYPEVFAVVSRMKHVSLLRDWPGYQAKGSAYPFVEAVAGAARLRRYGFLGRRIVVLGGRRVANAFGLADLDYFKPTHRDGVEFILAPHPSGVNRWWNNPGNRTRARVWIESLGRRLTLEMA
jgi:hypothetical protein